MDPESEIKEIYRKLTFKQPITFRYSAISSGFIGAVHGIVVRRPAFFFYYMALGVPIGGYGLCYKEYLRIYELK